jgi:MFS family permease
LFLLTVIPGLIVVCVAMLGLQEQSAVTKKEAPRLKLAPLDARFRLVLVALVVFTLGNASDAFLLVRAGELGVPLAWLPVLWCVFHIVKSSGNAVAGRVTDRIGSRPMLLAGWLVYALVYLAFAFATKAWHVWALFLAYGVFFALTEPAERKLAAALAGEEKKGLAFGWFNFAIGVAALPSSLIFGGIYEKYGPVAAFGWGAALAVLAAALLFAIRGHAAET